MHKILQHATSSMEATEMEYKKEKKKNDFAVCEFLKALMSWTLQSFLAEALIDAHVDTLGRKVVLTAG